MENEILIQGTKVKFDVGIKGTGKIVGVATSGQPFIGRSYIIEPDEPITNEVYNYSHFVVFECYLKLI